MTYDPSIALQIKPPDFDAAKPLNALANYQLAQAHSTLYGQQALLQGMKIKALQQYGEALKTGDEDTIREAIGRVGAADPESGQHMLAGRQALRQAKAQDTYGNTGDPAAIKMFPDVENTVIQTAAHHDENVRKQGLHKFQVGGQAMNGFLANPTPQSWEEALDAMEKSGAYHPTQTAPFRGKPNKLHAMRMQAAGHTAEQYMITSGQSKMNQPTEVSPTSDIVVPAEMGTGGGSILPNNEHILNPGPTKPETPASVSKNDPVFREVPKIELDSGPAQPGVIRKGQSPVQMKQKEDSQDYYKKEIRPAADLANKQMAELGSIRTMLEKGTLPTSRLAPLQETVAGWVYAVGQASGMPSDQAAAMAKGFSGGLDPTQADLFTKDSTRLGFDMARSQGAREAVQVIQFAFAANPNLRNTSGGNLVVTKVLEQLAQYNIDRAKYANAWAQKNGGHYVGFAEWWDQNHSIQRYTSKVVPYTIPTNPEELKPGVVYKGINSKTGKEFTGTWNPDTQAFD